jgi:hypothetical protein
LRDEILNLAADCRVTLLEMKRALTEGKRIAANVYDTSLDLEDSYMSADIAVLELQIDSALISLQGLEKHAKKYVAQGRGERIAVEAFLVPRLQDIYKARTLRGEEGPL